MNCLHCGDCCRRMSPYSAPKPCPYIIEKTKDRQTYILCSIYDKRPQECVNHSFSSRVCPIGLSMTNISDSESLRKRIDDGFSLCNDFIKEINND